MPKKVDISHTEQKIDLLKQRILTCQQYTQSFDLFTLQLSLKFQRHHQHYVSTLSQPLNVQCGGTRDDNIDSKTESMPMRKKKESILVFDLPAGGPRVNLRTTNPHLSSGKKGSNLAAASPVAEGPSILPKPYTPSFNSQDTHLIGDCGRKKKPVQENNFLSFLRRNSSRRRRAVKGIQQHADLLL